MKYFLVTLFLSLLVFSCKKKELTFTLKGSVTDNTFATSLAGAKLTLEEIPSGATEGAIYELIIPADGNYELNFKRTSAIKYILTITKENYFTVSEEISFSDFSTEEALVKNYSTTAMAWVKLRFVNQTPNSNNDLLRYIKQSGKVNCEICCPSVEQEIYGIANETRYCVNDANTIYSYYYWSENPSSQGLKEIMTPAFDTVELVLNY
jgi:hypothetical protein